MATVRDVLAAFEYYIGNGGYYEKASAKNLSRNVSDFAANRGSGNYTYMGKLCGVNPGAWCAMMVSAAVYEGCGSAAAARLAMWGVWPYTTCNQVFDAGLRNGASHYSWYQRSSRGKSGGSYTPKVGDVIVFSDNGTVRTHTGMVYAVDDNYVYTYEGNSGDMARKRSYSLKSSYIYGYTTLNLSAGDQSGIAGFQSWLGVEADGEYGPVTEKAALKAHQKAVGTAADGAWGGETYYATQMLRTGDEGDDVKVWQGMLYCRGFDPVGLDGQFGANTVKATEAFQTSVGLTPTGQADAYTWAKMFGADRPAHRTLKTGDTGAEVKYLQKLLWQQGYALETDGVFGPATADDVKDFQRMNSLTADGECGPETWAALE